MPDFPYPLAIPNYDRTTIKGCLESLGIDADNKLEEVKESLVAILNDANVFGTYRQRTTINLCVELLECDYLNITMGDVYKIVDNYILSNKEYFDNKTLFDIVKDDPSSIEEFEITYFDLAKYLGFAPEIELDVEYFKNYGNINSEFFKIYLYLDDFIDDFATLLDSEYYNEESLSFFLKRKHKLNFSFGDLPRDFDLPYFYRKTFEHFSSFEELLVWLQTDAELRADFVLEEITPESSRTLNQWCGLTDTDYKRLITLINDKAQVCVQTNRENPLVEYYSTKMLELFPNAIRFEQLKLRSGNIKECASLLLANKLCNYHTKEHFVKYVSLLTDIEHYGRFLETQQNLTPQITLGF